jgi:hypothetical protein
MDRLLTASLALAAAGCGGATVLFDFEAETDLAPWTLRSPQQDTLTRSERFATTGTLSLRFTTPAYKEGMEQWPAFEMKPPVGDWSGYDRLVIDITNPRGERPFLSLLISDGTVPFRNGLSYRFELPALGFRRFLVPLSGFPATVHRADIAIVHFFSQRPEADVELFVDNLQLLRPGEEPPPPSVAFVRQIAELTLTTVAVPEAILEACRKTLAAFTTEAASQARVEAELARVRQGLDTVIARARSASITLAELDGLASEINQLPKRCARLASRLAFERDAAEHGLQNDRLLVGFTTATEKILPRAVPFLVQCRDEWSIALARNEKESFQVLVLPRQGALTGVRVTPAGDLRAEGGGVFAASQIECHVTGYVKTEQRPPYAVSHVGWWPDPILDFLGPIDIAEDDLQSFWIRLRCPRTQAPGIYRGALLVQAGGAEPVRVPLTVRVYGFTLPDHTPLPTAITFFEQKGQMGGEANWDAMKLRYADFLADYYIDYDSLYRGGSPDYEVVDHLQRQGRLVAFNLGNVFNAGIEGNDVDKAIRATVDRLRPAYEGAAARGLLPYAYIYGFDERGKDQFSLLEQCAQALRQAFPEVLLMTTSYDHSFGLDSVVKTIDAWCPLTPQFRVDQAAKARAAGKYVWWYICCGPHNPHANWFVEYAAIESRLLMGAMTAKYRPDGFLYYSLTIWNRNHPIEKGPFTEWNPVSWTTYHGDGSLLCSGPGGKPVPTVRLENYRDGLEDFAYACILEECIRRVNADATLAAARKAWLAEAEAALTVPDTLVKTMAEYSRDPAALYAWRDRMATLIDASGIPDPNPWGEHFGVRGFGGRGQGGTE